MGYSCTDFTDDVLDLLVERELIHGDHIPDEDQAGQMALVRAAIESLIERAKHDGQRQPFAWCRTCDTVSHYSGDWYDGECPSCADKSEPDGEDPLGAEDFDEDKAEERRKGLDAPELDEEDGE